MRFVPTRGSGSLFLAEYRKIAKLLWRLIQPYFYCHEPRQHNSFIQRAMEMMTVGPIFTIGQIYKAIATQRLQRSHLNVCSQSERGSGIEFRIKLSISLARIDFSQALGFYSRYASLAFKSYLARLRSDLSHKKSLYPIAKTLFERAEEGISFAILPLCGRLQPCSHRKPLASTLFFGSQPASSKT